MIKPAEQIVCNKCGFSFILVLEDGWDHKKIDATREKLMREKSFAHIVKRDLHFCGHCYQEWKYLQEDIATMENKFWKK